MRTQIIKKINKLFQIKLIIKTYIHYIYFTFVYALRITHYTLRIKALKKIFLFYYNIKPWSLKWLKHHSEEVKQGVQYSPRAK